MVGTATGAEFCRAKRNQTGFSLVEVTIAIGIIAFAFTSILGLVPIALNTFHNSLDMSIGSQIAQRVTNDSQQTDFDQLIANPKTLRYFDIQGDEVLPTQGTTLTADQMAKVIYNVNVCVVPTTFLPGASATNQNLAKITVQVANNPGNRPLLSGSDNLWIYNSGMPITTYSMLVARKNYEP
jgi:uncharacterized protein (TIGR02598 family)